MKKITLMLALVGLSAQAGQLTSKPPTINAKITNTGSRHAKVTIHGVKTILNMGDTDVPPLKILLIAPGKSIIIDNSLIDDHYKTYNAAWDADTIYIEATPLYGPGAGKKAHGRLSLNKPDYQDEIELTGC